MGSNQGRFFVVIGLAGLVLAAVALAQPASLGAVRVLVEREHPGVPWVTPRELAREMQGRTPPTLLDTRTVAEFAVSRLRGARRVDPDAPRIEALGVPRSARIVVYCAVGYRSARVGRLLQQAGYTEVRNLEGGIFGWANEDHPVVRGDREVRDVHPYDAAWGRLLRAEYRTTSPR